MLKPMRKEWHQVPTTVHPVLLEDNLSVGTATGMDIWQKIAQSLSLKVRVTLNKVLVRELSKVKLEIIL